MSPKLKVSVLTREGQREKRALREEGKWGGREEGEEVGEKRRKKRKTKRGRG